MHFSVSWVSFFKSLKSTTLCNKSKWVVGSSRIIKGVSCAKALAIKTICNSGDLEIVRYALLKYFVEKDVPEIDLPKTGNYLFNVETLSTGLKLPIMAVPEEAEFKLISIN